MKKPFMFGLVAVAVAAMASVAGAAGQSAIYDAIPSPLPPNLPSLGYQATQTAEFGDYVSFAGTNRRASSVTVTMSDWAKHSDYPSMPADGWTHPITLNLYAVDHTGPDPASGTLLGTETETFAIPWRPEPDPTCGTAWRADDGNCYNGLAFNITFDLSSLDLVLPEEVVYGIAYNTNTWGYDPIGEHGPFESLNVGLLDTTPAVGADVEPDATFWNTATAANYSDDGTGGVGTFRRDTNWSPYTPAVQFVTSGAVPANKNDCKKGGWESVAREDGSGFKNQGDCIQYFNTGK